MENEFKQSEQEKKDDVFINYCLFITFVLFIIFGGFSTISVDKCAPQHMVDSTCEY